MSTEREETTLEWQRADRLARYVARVVDGAPTLSAAQVDRLALLVRGGVVDAAHYVDRATGGPSRPAGPGGDAA